MQYTNARATDIYDLGMVVRIVFADGACVESSDWTVDTADAVARCHNLRLDLDAGKVAVITVDGQPENKPVIHEAPPGTFTEG